MNETPLISVIIPVYNAEKYLGEAVESVIAQTYRHWELLVVDDGSTDNSVPVIENYAAKDGRIRLYQNDSGEHGPGIARNYGMDHIRGKYTYFMDADDWIEKDLLADTVALAEETGADLVPFGYVIADAGKNTRKKCSPCGNFEYADFKKIANEIARGTWGFCHQLTRSELLKDVRFAKYRTCEDCCFQMDLLCHVKRVCGIDREYHYYRQVHDSVSHTAAWDGSFAETCVALCKKEIRFLEYCGLQEDSQDMKNTVIERYTGCIYWICKRPYPLTVSEKCRQIHHIGNMIEIQKYKKDFDCTRYPFVRRIVKFLVKHNMETAMLFAGTLYFKIFG